jgi:hypothetical protein
MEAACRIYFVVDHWIYDGANEWLGRYVEGLREQVSDAVCVADDPARATHILFLDAGRQRTRFWEPNPLARHPLVTAYPQKCYIWNTEDRPASYLPGIYVSMPRKFFRARIHRAFRYTSLNTERLPVPPAGSRDLLYNFIGAPTSPARRKLLSAEHPPDAMVRETLNFNHQRWAPDDAVAPYVDVLARSRFTLCPPGSATSSYRIFEAMRAGSIPVLISDELVLPHGPEWPECSVTIPEKDATQVPDILSAVPNSGEMGRAAQAAFGHFFDSAKMLDHITRELRMLGVADQVAARRSFNWERLWRGWEKARRALARTA